MTTPRQPLISLFSGGGFGENGYVASCPATKKGLLIDPGAAVTSMLEAVEDQGISVSDILLTHAHVDHIDGVARAKRATGAPIHLHRDDAPLYDQASLQAQMFGVHLETPPPLDEYLRHGQVVSFGECSFEVRHTPGHSPGHVILVSPGLAIVGDCVFSGSIGRSDLPGGDFQTLMASIRGEILSLPDETVLFPGHGPTTTVGHERVSNPFLAPQFGGSRFV